MKISEKQMQAVMALPAPRRFEHFVKVVADHEEVWGLYGSGWVLSGAEDGAVVFPIWPAKEYAQACALEEWSGCEARMIPLGEFLDVLLPQLERDGVLPGVFATPLNKGMTPSVEEVRQAIGVELQRY